MFFFLNKRLVLVDRRTSPLNVWWHEMKVQAAEVLDVTKDEVFTALLCAVDMQHRVADCYAALKENWVATFAILLKVRLITGYV